MKKLSVIILISIFSLGICSNVFACEMSEQYKEWLKLSSEERKKVIEPYYCKEAYQEQPTSMSISDINKLVFKDPSYLDVLKGTNDSSYITPTLTPAKYQDGSGSCWAFSSIGMLETLAAKDNYGLLDLSEKHMIFMLSNKLFTNYTNPDGFNLDTRSGGNINITTNYIYSSNGPVYESQVPFDDSPDPVSSNGYIGLKTDFLLNNYYRGDYNRGSCTDSQIKLLKQFIYQYGSVGISIKMSTVEPAFKGGKYLNYQGREGKDHAVILVGWDDDLNKSNFGNNPTRNGAFIAKNSWSTSFGENGLFYISYDDVYVCEDYSVFTGLSPNKYDKVYRAGKAFANGYYAESTNENDKEVGTLATKFTVSETTYLSRISFDAPAGVRYNVYYSKNGYQENTIPNWKHLAYGDTTYDGIYTATFNDMEVSGTFYIIVDYSSTNSFEYQFYCSPKSTDSLYYDGQTPTAGRNFAYYGGLWRDMSTINTNSNSIYGCSNGIVLYTSKNKVYGDNGFSVGNITGSLKVDDFTSTISVAYSISNNTTIDFNPTIDIHAKNSTESIKDHFDVTIDKTNKKIIIKQLSHIDIGNYDLDITFDGIKKTVGFSIIPDISFRTYTIKDGMIIIPIPSKLAVSYTEFVNDMVKGADTSYKVTDSSGTIISSGNIKTGYRFIVEGSTYTIVVQGDINQDGKVSSLDYVKIKNHIMGTNTITNTILKMAADANNDGNIKSTDYVRIKNYIMAYNG